MSIGCPAFAGHDAECMLLVGRSSSFIKPSFIKPSSIAPGERAPGRLWGCPPIRGGEAPTGAGAERRTRWPPCGWACPFSGRERPVHDADRLAFRRFTAAVSLDPETAFWKRTGAADRRNALDSAGFPPRSSTPTSRVAPTDPRSWAGQCLPRPPEVRLRRPNPQAPHPPRSHASHENALGRVDRMSEHQTIEQIKNKKPNPVNCFWGRAPRTERHPRGRDCSVALRALRNDDGSVSARHIRRHCEPPGPAFGRPDDRLREAISPPCAERRINIRCGLSRQLTRCLGVIAFEKARRERDRRRAPTAHGFWHESCRKASPQDAIAVGIAPIAALENQMADGAPLIRLRAGIQ